jgi:hypothetical protein
VDSAIYVVLSVIAAMTLLVTIKLSVTGRVMPVDGGKPSLLFHPIWLGPLAAMVPYVIGAYLGARLSPWPVASYTTVFATSGLWPAILAAISTATVDLWLFWTTATALIAFTEPLAPIYDPIPKQLHKYYHLVNIAAGAFVVYKALTATGA